MWFEMLFCQFHHTIKPLPKCKVPPRQAFLEKKKIYTHILGLKQVLSFLRVYPLHTQRKQHALNSLKGCMHLRGVCVREGKKERRRVAYISVCEVAETWCACNRMRPMAPGECQRVLRHHQLLRARKWGPQPFTVWTNKPIRRKTWLSMRRSHSRRVQDGAVGRNAHRS